LLRLSGTTDRRPRFHKGSRKVSVGMAHLCAQITNEKRVSPIPVLRCYRHGKGIIERDMVPTDRKLTFDYTQVVQIR